MKLLILLTTLVAFPALAAEHDHDHDHDHQHREHGVHEHGRANLNLAWSGHEVEIEFNSPAMNIVGFEHQAKSKADRQAVANAVAALKQPLGLISPTAAADCKLEKVAVHSELLGKHEEAHGHDGHDDHKDAHGHDDHKGHDDDHKEHAKAEKHEHEHEHKDDYAEHSEQQHSDFEVTIGYHCDAPGKLAAFDLKGLFKAFPGIEDLDVQWISDAKQSSAELNAKRTLISLQ